jgi:hypothetical protein
MVGTLFSGDAGAQTVAVTDFVSSRDFAVGSTGWSAPWPSTMSCSAASSDPTRSRASTQRRTWSRGRFRPGWDDPLVDTRIRAAREDGTGAGRPDEASVGNDLGLPWGLPPGPAICRRDGEERP